MLSSLLKMKPSSNGLYRDLLSIGKLIADEVSREVARRGSVVPTHDPVVRENVCRRLLGNGARISAHATAGGWVFTELTPVEEELPDLRWMENNVAA